MWSNDSNMKKKTKILILIILSFLTAVTLWAAANLKRISDLGEKTKTELMKIYNLSNTQMKRIINKKNE